MKFDFNNPIVRRFWILTIVFGMFFLIRFLGMVLF